MAAELIEFDKDGVSRSVQGETFRVPFKEVEGMIYIKLNDVIAYVDWRVKQALKAYQR